MYTVTLIGRRYLYSCQFFYFITPPTVYPLFLYLLLFCQLDSQASGVEAKFAESWIGSLTNQKFHLSFTILRISPQLHIRASRLCFRVKMHNLNALILGKSAAFYLIPFWNYSQKMTNQPTRNSISLFTIVRISP